MSDFMSGIMSAHVSDRMSESMSGRMSEFMSNSSDSVSDRMPEVMSDRISECMSDRMSEMMCVYMFAFSSPPNALMAHSKTEGFAYLSDCTYFLHTHTHVSLRRAMVSWITQCLHRV